MRHVDMHGPRGAQVERIVKSTARVLEISAHACKVHLNNACPGHRPHPCQHTHERDTRNRCCRCVLCMATKTPRTIGCGPFFPLLCFSAVDQQKCICGHGECGCERCVHYSHVRVGGGSWQGKEAGVRAQQPLLQRTGLMDYASTRA